MPEALASLLRTVVVALFLLTFVLQPFLIPSESMEHTLLVGDFLLFNKQVYAPAGKLTRWLMPYRDVERGDIVVFHHPQPPLLVKRVVGVPGDRLRIEDGRVIVNGAAARRALCGLRAGAAQPLPRQLSRHGLYRPAGRSRLVDADAEPDAQRRAGGAGGRVFCARRQPQSQQGFPLLGLCAARRRLWPGRWSSTSRSRRPSTTDVQQAALEAGDDRLGHDRQLSARLTGFARWKRIFHVVH